MKKVLFLLAMAAPAFGAAAVHPGNLRCEYRTNPQGIDVTEPRLSWLLTGAAPSARGLRQTAYRIVVASTESALKASNGKLISEMEDLTGKTVLVKSDPLLHQENFDIH